MSKYESSDVALLKAEIARIEPIIEKLELQVGMKLRQKDKVEKEERRVLDEYASIPQNIRDSERDWVGDSFSERLKKLRDMEERLMEEFTVLRDAYEEEWYGFSMLKSRLKEISEADIEYVSQPRLTKGD